MLTGIARGSNAAARATAARVVASSISVNSGQSKQTPVTKADLAKARRSLAGKGARDRGVQSLAKKGLLKTLLASKSIPIKDTPKVLAGSVRRAAQRVVTAKLNKAQVGNMGLSPRSQYVVAEAINQARSIWTGSNAATKALAAAVAAADMPAPATADFPVVGKKELAKGRRETAGKTLRDKAIVDLVKQSFSEALIAAKIVSPLVLPALLSKSVRGVARKMVQAKLRPSQAGFMRIDATEKLIVRTAIQNAKAVMNGSNSAARRVAAIEIAVLETRRLKKIRERAATKKKRAKPGASLFPRTFFLKNRQIGTCVHVKESSARRGAHTVWWPGCGGAKNKLRAVSTGDKDGSF